MSLNIPCKFQEHRKQGRLLNRALKRSNFSPRFEFTSECPHYILALFSSIICTCTTSKKDKIAFKRTLDYFPKKLPEYANNWLVSRIAVKAETVNVTANRVVYKTYTYLTRVVCWLHHTVLRRDIQCVILPHFFTGLFIAVAYTGDFFRKVTEGPFWCKFCFLLVVHVQMILENNANK